MQTEEVKIDIKVSSDRTSIAHAVVDGLLRIVPLSKSQDLPEGYSYSRIVVISTRPVNAGNMFVDTREGYDEIYSAVSVGTAMVSSNVTNHPIRYCSRVCAVSGSSPKSRYSIDDYVIRMIMSYVNTYGRVPDSCIVGKIYLSNKGEWKEDLLPSEWDNEHFKVRYSDITIPNYECMNVCKVKTEINLHPIEFNIYHNVGDRDIKVIVDEWIVDMVSSFMPISHYTANTACKWLSDNYRAYVFKPSI